MELVAVGLVTVAITSHATQLTTNAVYSFNLPLDPQLVQLVLVMLDKKRGLQSSPILFLFWFLLMFCGIGELQTLIRQYDMVSDLACCGSISRQLLEMNTYMLRQEHKQQSCFYCNGDVQSENTIIGYYTVYCLSLLISS